VSEISDRYRRRADLFEQTVRAVDPDAWDNQSPCTDWRARDVVGHVVEMHGFMLRPLTRGLSPAPSIEDDPLGAFLAARADIETVLDNFAIAGIETDTPMGNVTIEQHVDGVVSTDLIIHRWDLARGTGQDDTIDPDELPGMWAGAQQIPEQMRTPGAFGPGIVVFGPLVVVPDDAPLQDRLLGLLGRNPSG
jgi:uncharacterized protein (TIGR03086 family)